jgi:hypothetical protein
VKINTIVPTINVIDGVAPTTYSIGLVSLRAEYIIPIMPVSKKHIEHRFGELENVVDLFDNLKYITRPRKIVTDACKTMLIPLNILMIFIFLSQSPLPVSTEKSPRLDHPLLHMHDEVIASQYPFEQG